MKRLTYLANKYGTDKGTTCSFSHGFTEIYNDYFQKIADKCYEESRKVNILEIGVFNAKSLYMYNEFFDGNCEIYGMDIDQQCLNYATENIHISICNQGDRNELSYFLKNINVKFDIIVDDGSHIPMHQIISLASLYKTLSKDGIYILEDLHTNLNRSWYGIDTEIKDTALYYLTFRQPSIFLTEEENNELEKNIKTVSIYSVQNSNNYEFNNKSITSIITFNDNEI